MDTAGTAARTHSLAPGLIRVRVGCELRLTSDGQAPMMAIVEADGLRASDAPGQRLVERRRSAEPEVPLHEYLDGFGNRVWRLLVPAGEFAVRFDSVFEVAATSDPLLPGLVKHGVEELPDEVLVYLMPSRHCQSDLLLDDAWRLFGSAMGGWEQVQAVSDWLHANVVYGQGSTASTSSLEAYQARRGVCRDFAQLGVAFCRALNIPARYVCGYLPDIGVPVDPVPMDFHAWFEAYLGGGWRTFDARHNKPRTGRVVIARGRDAVDTAFATTYGSTRLTRLTVWADEVAPDFSLDGPARDA